MAEVAEVLDLTPAYVKGVVTFYTMYHQHPVGEAFHPGLHDVAVQRLRRRSGRRRVPQAHRLPGARPDVARRQVHGDRSRMPRRVRVRDADHDQRGLHRVGDAGEGAGDSRRDSNNAWDIRTSRIAREVARSLQVFWRREDAITLDGWKKRGGYAALAEGARHVARRHRQRREGLRAARPRRRRIPDGRQVVVHEAGRRQAALPLLQRRRVRAGHVQGSRDHALDAARPRRRAARSARTRSAPRRATSTFAASSPSRIARVESGAQGSYAAGILGKNAMGTRQDGQRLGASRRGRVHLRRRDRAHELARGEARQSAHQAAVPGGVGRVRAADDDQQRRDARRGAAHPQQRRRLVQAVDARRQPEEHGHQALFGVRQHPEARQLRSADGLSVQGFPVRPLRRSAAGPQVQGDHPRRHLGADSDGRRSRSEPHGLRGLRRARARCSAPAA